MSGCRGERLCTDAQAGLREARRRSERAWCRPNGSTDEEYRADEEQWRECERIAVVSTEACRTAPGYCAFDTSIRLNAADEAGYDTDDSIYGEPQVSGLLCIRRDYFDSYDCRICEEFLFAGMDRNPPNHCDGPCAWIGHDGMDTLVPDANAARRKGPHRFAPQTGHRRGFPRFDCRGAGHLHDCELHLAANSGRHSAIVCSAICGLRWRESSAIRRIGKRGAGREIKNASPQTSNAHGAGQFVAAGVWSLCCVLHASPCFGVCFGVVV